MEEELKRVSKKVGSSTSRFDDMRGKAKKAEATSAAAIHSLEADIEAAKSSLATATLNLEDGKTAHKLRERELRAINDSRVSELEKFRIKATRAQAQKKKNHDKDWSKVQ